MPLDRTKLLNTFYTQAEKKILDANKGFSQILATGKGAESLAELRRFVHTVKGDATMLGLEEVIAAARDIEELVDRLVLGEAPVDAETLKPLILKTSDLVIFLKKSRSEATGTGT